MSQTGTYTLKNGADLRIREGVVTDAAMCLEFIEKVSAQSTFLTFGPGEFGLSLQEKEEMIRKKSERANEIYLMGMLGDQLVSQMTVNSSQRSRLRHAVEFGISVDKKHWGNGVGEAMVSHLLQWAENNPIIRKVNLQVLPQNTNAIGLYKKLGFAQEGRKLRDNLKDGVFSDVLLMGKLID